MDNVRLPDSVEAGAKGGPSFLTTVVTLGNGIERRNQSWSVARHSWDIGYGISTSQDFQTVRDFFYACGGRARSFLFKDWSDYQGTLEAVAPVTDQALQRDLVKTYANGVVSYQRLIRYPVDGTLNVYVDTMLTVDYTIDNGRLTFTDDPGENVVATFEFDISVRFDTDQLDVTVQNIKAMEIPSIPVIEVLGE